MPGEVDELRTPSISAGQLLALMRPMELDLQAVYAAAMGDTMDLLDRAASEGWTSERYVAEVEAMWDEGVEAEDLVARALPEVRYQGLRVKVENRPGSVRQGVDEDGHRWRTRMSVPYGFLKGTRGADGEEVDVFLGPDRTSQAVFVFHVAGADEGDGYDEDKIVLGCSGLDEAARILLSHYDRPVRYEVEGMTVDEFRERLEDSDGEPIGEGPSEAMAKEASEESGEPSRYAEVAERRGRFGGEHVTPMSGGNVQKQKTDARVADRMGYGDTPVIQPSAGLNPFEDGRSDKAEVSERNREKETEEREGKMRSNIVEKKCTPRGNESQAKFMDRCIHEKGGGAGGQKAKDAANQCYAIWHSSKGTSRKSQDQEQVVRSALVRMVVRKSLPLARAYVERARVVPQDDTEQAKAAKRCR